jgi:hypothetical protein
VCVKLSTIMLLVSTLWNLCLPRYRLYQFRLDHQSFNGFSSIAGGGTFKFPVLQLEGGVVYVRIETEIETLP